GSVKVTILWPSGLVQTLSGLPLNHRVSIQEGDDSFRAEPFRAPSTPLSAGPSTTAGGNGGEPRSAETWLYEPFPAPGFTLRDLDGREHSLSGLAGRPALIQL